MSQTDREFRKTFFQALAFEEVGPDDPRHVRLRDDPAVSADDPVRLLREAIQFSSAQSVRLLSGYRGVGKSSELKRLKRDLEAEGYVVVLCDMEDYLNMSTPVDVSDFLFAVAGAFGDGLAAALGANAGIQGPWDRFVAFLSRTNVEFTEIGWSGGGVDLKASLQSDPTFRERLQQRMAGHITALTREVHAYVRETVSRLKDVRQDGAEVVLLLDSIEHIRGTSSNAPKVQSSVEQLFAAHADKLHLPLVHVIYTVPPFLKIRYPNIGQLFRPGGVLTLPAIRVRHRVDRSPDPGGMKALRNLIERRGDWRRLLGSDAVLDEIILASGGHLRDLMRLFHEIILRAKSLPVDAATIQSALTQVRGEFLPLADTDARWLAQIATSGLVELPDQVSLPELARFFDTHVVLTYMNGEEWYDAHPLIRDTVLDQARRNPLPVAPAAVPPGPPAVP